MKWEDLGRQDLKIIPAMQQQGYTVLFDGRDTQAGRTTPEHIPQFAVSFQKGKTRVWFVATHWKVAELDNGHFKNHRNVDDPVKGPIVCVV